ncbi:hypothetical protein D9611_014558 [Ephemerocybe angulata]|uniref:GATA-type domain-containing protein n=1 Tax=Ephemerocybe angulata TaxID=980116 RepID=A0A8H5FIZ4_9AGAR|nr:hypothetical protein D9611_014558 [Tulosesus angulatus]
MAQFGWNDDDEQRKDAPTPSNDTPQKAVPAELIDPALRPDNNNPKRPMSRTHRLPSPPASIMPPPSHSPSPSIQSSGATAQDRATSTSTPPVRRSPPTLHGPPPSLFSSSYHHDGQQQQPRADLGPPPPAHGGYLYAPPQHGSHSHSQAHSHPPPPPFDPRYDAHHQHHPPPYHTASGLPTHFASVQQQGQMSHHHPHPGSYGHPQAAYPPPGQAPVTIVHTDDAATKLSDRVRRRCFNCCTTDTSTWRRSNLSPGKVLCNKCGLFERTHSRPRPEQFPHKRGPLATTSLQRRTPPAQQGQGQPQHQLPPHAQQQQQQHSQHVQYGGGQQQHTLPPIGGQYTYSHPSIAPLSGGPGDRHGGLPGLGPWVDNGPPPPQSQQQGHSQHGPNSHSGPASHGSHGPSSHNGGNGNGNGGGGASGSANGNGNGSGGGGGVGGGRVGAGVRG